MVRAEHIGVPREACDAGGEGFGVRYLGRWRKDAEKGKEGWMRGGSLAGALSTACRVAVRLKCAKTMLVGRGA